MKQVGGVWLPDGEEHLVEWMKKMNRVVDGKLTYQLHKLEAALTYVRDFRTAVDVGAHCGLWSMHLAKRFQMLYAFEPMAEHRACFEKNVPAAGNVWLSPCALGEKPAHVKMHTAPTSSGDTWVDGEGDIEMVTLDSLNIERIDFLKIDCEGYELFVLKGGVETLQRSKPVVIVEQKPGKGQHFGLPQTAAVEFLTGLGAKLRREMSGDYILSWD